jgi:hypothetical protein
MSTSRTIIETGDIANGAITQAKREALNKIASSGCGTFDLTASAMVFTDITNLSCTITTTGRPVYIIMQPIFTGSGSYSYMIHSSSGAFIKLLRDSTSLFQENLGTFQNHSARAHYIDTPSAGTYTYKFQLARANNTTVQVIDYQLVVFEL